MLRSHLFLIFLNLLLCLLLRLFQHRLQFFCLFLIVFPRFLLKLLKRKLFLLNCLFILSLLLGVRILLCFDLCNKSFQLLSLIGNLYVHFGKRILIMNEIIADQIIIHNFQLVRVNQHSLRNLLADTDNGVQ